MSSLKADINSLKRVVNDFIKNNGCGRQRSDIAHGKRSRCGQTLHFEEIPETIEEVAEADTPERGAGPGMVPHLSVWSRQSSCLEEPRQSQCSDREGESQSFITGVSSGCPVRERSSCSQVGSEEWSSTI